MSINNEWHKLQIELYTKEYKFYELYAEILKKMLAKACEIYAPQAIIETRAKAVSSFAEKAIRKSHKYDNPAQQFTDLCGARVITHTQSQVNAVCSFIKANFIIDEVNSLDVKTRLKKNEFGYLSLHYVVSLPDKPVLCIPIPEELLGKKAEIQVRTILQHAWADITHDRIYKNSFSIPEKIQREVARLAALMENADESFSVLTKSIDSYKLSYDTYMDEKEIQNEIEVLQTVLENEPLEKNKPLLALRIAKIAKASEEWGLIIKTLEPFVTQDIEMNRYVKSEIFLELGNSLCRYYKNEIYNPQYKKGQLYIEKSIAPEDQNSYASMPVTQEEKALRAKSLSTLGWTYINSHDKKAAEDLYLKSFEHDSQNPYLLSKCLEFFFNGTSYFPLMKQTILDAITTCRSHINNGLELPQAYFTIGRLHLLLQNFFEGIDAYIEGIHYCSTHQIPVSTSSVLFSGELEFLKSTNFTKQYPTEFDLIYKILLLGMTCILKEQAPLDELKNYAVNKQRFNESVIIISGDVDMKPPSDSEKLEKYLYSALESYNGSIIMNGATFKLLGIIEQVIKAHQNKESNKSALIAYTIDSYSGSISNSSNSILKMEGFIQYWIDIVSEGITPNQVMLLGINGSSLTDIEYKLALALGALTAVIGESGGAAAGVLNNDAYANSLNLVSIPMDPMSIKALLLYKNSCSLLPEHIEAAAQAIHQNYLTTAKPKDPSLNAWESLDESLKNSNRHQARFCEEILKSCGYTIRPCQGEPVIPHFTDEELIKMAEFEHGRWVAERLLNGWKYGVHKDIVNKISPYIVPWNKLSDEIKKYDLYAVENYVTILRKAGFEVVKP